MTMTIDDINTKLEGVAAIDYYFAQTFCEQVQLDEDGQSCWFAILLALSYMQRQGHTCLSLELIAGNVLFSDDENASGITYPSLTRLIQVTRQALSQYAAPVALVYEKGLLYSRRYWQFEDTIAQAIADRQQPILLTDNEYQACEDVWPRLFSVTQCAEQDWQQIAVASTLVQRFSVINGGPGTGKTYTVTRLLLALQAMSGGTLKIQLAAPTGKAAQRLTESVSQSLEQLEGQLDAKLLEAIPRDASTLHRLLGLARFGVRARRDQSAPLDIDVLIVDEASMVDVALMARLMRALPPDVRVYLIGDADQLPAVESGNVLESMIGELPEEPAVTSSMRAHLVRLCPHLPLLPLAANLQADAWVHSLRKSQRFGGKLAEVATAIQSGRTAHALSMISSTASAQDALGKEDVLMSALPENPQSLKSLAKASFAALFSCRTPQQALDALRHCRWLTPLRQGPFGVESINRLIEQALAESYSVLPGGQYAGRPIMVVENQYAQRLFNGDVGVLWPDNSGQLKAWFEDAAGGVRALSLSWLPRVETVFAMTVHKSQGSEFSQVVMIVPDSESAHSQALNNRSLLYTGLTRAKQGALLISNREILSGVIARKQERVSGLSYRLRQIQAGQEMS
ncbi:exodeoxyribonuclease V subunit alpha [Alteromonas sp. H39]|uniref:exodeoxyribonuclease V subunit alpha n=1 Tax=Alteromonas sp. H39 TaxID=3389876 RepID=UPI0039E00D54